MNKPSRCPEGLLAFGGGEITLLTGLGHKQDNHEPFAEGDHASVMLLDQNRILQHSIFLPAPSMITGICLSPDQTHIYLAQKDSSFIASVLITPSPTLPSDPFAAGQKGSTEPAMAEAQSYGELEVAKGTKPDVGGPRSTSASAAKTSANSSSPVATPSTNAPRKPKASSAASSPPSSPLLRNSDRLQIRVMKRSA
jgi:hypothetical protein